MKTLFFAFVIVLVGSACTSPSECIDESEFTLIGQWGLVESCFDIGDGTKICEDHNKESGYEYFDDGTVRIFNSDQNCLSEYEVMDNVISITNFDGGECLSQSFFFGVMDACSITISPFCFEGCPHRYERIN